MQPLGRCMVPAGAYGGQGDLSLGVENTGPDNEISDGFPLRYELVYTGTSKKNQE